MIHTGQIANSHNGEQRTRDEIAAGLDERGKRITERGDGLEQEQQESGQNRYRDWNAMVQSQRAVKVALGLRSRR